MKLKERINKIIENICKVHKTHYWKDWLFALIALLFIALPFHLTYISFINHHFVVNSDSKRPLSIFNLDFLIASASLISLIINNWVKNSNSEEKENHINLISKTVFLLSLIFLFCGGIMIGGFSIYNNYILFSLINFIIALASFTCILFIPEVILFFDRNPYLLYATLWGVLLLIYFIYSKLAPFII